MQFQDYMDSWRHLTDGFIRFQRASKDMFGVVKLKERAGKRINTVARCAYKVDVDTEIPYNFAYSAFSAAFRLRHSSSQGLCDVLTNSSVMSEAVAEDLLRSMDSSLWLPILEVNNYAGDHMQPRRFFRHILNPSVIKLQRGDKYSIWLTEMDNDLLYVLGDYVRPLANIEWAIDAKHMEMAELARNINTVCAAYTGDVTFCDWTFSADTFKHLCDYVSGGTHQKNVAKVSGLQLKKSNYEPVLDEFAQHFYYHAESYRLRQGVLK